MMSDKPRYQMTASTHAELEARLKYLEDIEKPALAARLKSAIAMGDLRENADYHAAKEEQAFLEGEINRIKEQLQGALIVDESKLKKVTVIEEGMDEAETFVIVGPIEADPGHGKISNESPLGKALITAKKGDTVRVEAPLGEIVFKVLEVS